MAEKKQEEKYKVNYTYLLIYSYFQRIITKVRKLKYYLQIRKWLTNNLHYTTNARDKNLQHSQSTVKPPLKQLQLQHIIRLLTCRELNTREQKQSKQSYTKLIKTRGSKRKRCTYLGHKGDKDVALHTLHATPKKHFYLDRDA